MIFVVKDAGLCGLDIMSGLHKFAGDIKKPRIIGTAIPIEALDYSPSTAHPWTFYQT